MSVLLIVGPRVRWPRRKLPLVSHDEYDDGTDRQTDGRTDAASVISAKQCCSLQYSLFHVALSQIVFINHNRNE